MADLLRRLARQTADELPEGELERRLEAARREGRPLRVKLGLDPTARSVTLGQCVVLQRLRAFQDAGHQAVLIVGDATARVGDPSLKSKTRPMLELAEIDSYAGSMLAQFGRIVDLERAEVRRNSEWLDALGVDGLLRLASRVTVARLLERDDFARRWAARTPISLLELLYPLLQGYDSVAIRADVELGGTDQTFNLLMGRFLQQELGQEPQVALTSPLLVGLDGHTKMSQSLGNSIDLGDDADAVYGKAMSIPDAAMPQWLELASGLEPAAIDAAVGSLVDGGLPPVEAKRLLARSIVTRFHGVEAAAAAQSAFNDVHRDHGLPAEVRVVALPTGDVASLPALIVEHLGARSRSDARRLIEGGGVRLAGKPMATLEVPVADLVGQVLQVGRRRFVRFADA